MSLLDSLLLSAALYVLCFPCALLVAKLVMHPGEPLRVALVPANPDFLHIDGQPTFGQHHDGCARWNGYSPCDCEV